MTSSKILNVDDREVNRYIRTQILQGAGFHVVEAATGAQALEMLRTEQPHLVLLDVNLPDLSGSEVCYRIKSFPTKVTVVVLQISSIAIDNDQRVSALEGGADGYLTEPVSADLLVAQVRSLLRLRQAEERLRDSEQRYRISTEALARSNEELQHFAYAASHDLQEPLRTTMLYSQLLVRKYRDQLDPEAQEYVDIIGGSATRMQRLLQDLLAYMQTGSKQGAPTSSVDTEQVLKMTNSHLAASIDESGATIAHGALPIVRGDMPQLTQVFQNLIGNAIKYRSTNPLKIHVSAERRDGEWMFAIRDNGRGFETKYAEQIFGVFKRLHGQEVSGSGIGLALCRRIIERHEGRIWAESQVNEGTTFYFTLPGDPAERWERLA